MRNLTLLVLPLLVAGLVWLADVVLDAPAEAQ